MDLHLHLMLIVHGATLILNHSRIQGITVLDRLDHPKNDFFQIKRELKIIDHVDVFVDVKADHNLSQKLDIFLDPAKHVSKVALDPLIRRFLPRLERLSILLKIVIEVLHKVKHLVLVRNTILLQHFEEAVLLFGRQFLNFLIDSVCVFE